jgi:hypothetical protein
MGDRWRAEQHEDQDNPHHDRLRFSQKLRFCAAAPFFGSMFTGLRRGPEPAPLFVLRHVHTARTLRPIVSAATDQARSVNGTVIALAVLPGRPIVAGFGALSFQFPDSPEGGLLAWGRSKRVSAMTHKAITLEFVVPTVFAIVLGIVLSIGAVYLIDNYLAPIDQAEAYHSVAGGL